MGLLCGIGHQRKEILPSSSASLKFGTSLSVRKGLPSLQLPTLIGGSQGKIQVALKHMIISDRGAFRRHQVLEYMNWIKPVIQKLLEALLNGINVKQIDEVKESALMGSPTVTLLHYPKCPDPDLAAGAGPHSDISLITVLLQDDVGGLYVRVSEGDKWIHVTPIKGALVVNIGDVLQILSNDRYKSPEHRVFVNGSKDRISVLVFVNPSSDAIIGPLHEVMECNMTKQVWLQIKKWLCITRAMSTIKSALKYIKKEARGTSWQSRAKRSAVACTVYHIWTARNRRLFEGTIVTSDGIIREIKTQVYKIMFSLYPHVLGQYEHLALGL
ncbi:hypothetical protein DH2020_025301 [Rehmannia glutinosa]|uniref:Fe2OG dioxygenase domain-containing protein n=1 Tax=Rehmannia glutinosa TaxID=99300 RepID=A0ABR0W3P7_REHGL